MADHVDDLEANYQSGSSSTPTSSASAVPVDDFESNYQKQLPPYSIMSDIFSRVAKIPAGIGNMVTSIPDGVSNLVHLPGDLYGAGSDYLKLVEEDAMKGQPGEKPLTPADMSGADYGRAERTLRGVGSIAATVAGGGVAPAFTGLLGTSLGSAAALEGFNKLNQGTGADAVTTAGQDANGFADNIIAGLVPGLAIKGAGGALSKLGGAIEPMSAEESMARGLGINVSDVKRAAKFKGQSALGDAVNGATERGVFTGDSEPTSIQARNEAAIADLGKQLHGDGNIPGVLQVGDAYQQGPITPTFDNAQAFVTSNPFQASTLQSQLQNRLATISSVWDGTISGLSKVKSKLGQIAYDGTTDSKALDQALYQDLKSAVETHAEAAMPGLGEQVKGLNSDLSEHYTLQPILDRAINKRTAASFQAPEASGIGSVLARAVGGGGAGALASVLGTHGVTVPAVLAGAAIKGVPAALRNPLIGGMVSDGIGGLGAGLSMAGGIVQPGDIMASNNVQDPRQAQIDALLASLFSKGGDVSIPSNGVSTPKASATPTAGSDLVKAIIQQESGGKANITSPVGAQGLMQLMPATGHELAKRAGVSYDPMNPEQNQHLGTMYINQLLEKYGGDTRLALASYNWGMGHLDNLIRRLGTSDFSKLKAHLPSETQDYVDNITGNLDSGTG